MVTSPGAGVVGYRNDPDGNRTKLLYPDGTAVTYTFDKASRLSGLTDWASRNTGYSYLPDGHIHQPTNVNGTLTQYGYDNAQRLTQVLNQDSSANVIDQPPTPWTASAPGRRWLRSWPKSVAARLPRPRPMATTGCTS